MTVAVGDADGLFFWKLWYISAHGWASGARRRSTGDAIVSDMQLDLSGFACF